MAPRKPKLPILTLTPEQESEATSKIKRFMEDRFELVYENYWGVSP